MRVNNFLTRLVAALSITVLLNGALVTAFGHAAAQAQSERAAVRGV